MLELKINSGNAMAGVCMHKQNGLGMAGGGERER